MSHLRQRFIEDMEKFRVHRPMDMSVSTRPGEEGRFLDKKTHLMWLGYELAHEAGFYKDKELLDDSVIMGTYVVGNNVGPGVKVIMSKAPMIQKSRAKAFSEANRLAEEHDSTFAVFRCVKTFKPQEV